MNHIFWFVLLIYFSNCSIRGNQENRKLISDLMGSWVNTKIDSLDKKLSLSEIFKPVSGFTLKTDSTNGEKIITLYYGEQTATWTFDSLYITNDSIMGQHEHQNRFIGIIDKDQKLISRLSLIDYSVYDTLSFNAKVSETKFKKISSCSADCMFEQFIVERTSNLFPVTVEFKSDFFNLNTIRKDCDCNQKLTGFPNYTDYQILDYQIDDSLNVIVRLALFNLQEHRNHFFNLRMSKTKNILQEIP